MYCPKDPKIRRALHQAHRLTPSARTGHGNAPPKLGRTAGRQAPESAIRWTVSAAGLWFQNRAPMDNLGLQRTNRHRGCIFGCNKIHTHTNLSCWKTWRLYSTCSPPAHANHGLTLRQWPLRCPIRAQVSARPPPAAGPSSAPPKDLWLCRLTPKRICQMKTYKIPEQFFRSQLQNPPPRRSPWRAASRRASIRSAQAGLPAGMERPPSGSSVRHSR